MVTSLPCEIEECAQPVAKLIERGVPRREQVVTLGCQRVRALRRAGEVRAPLGGDDAVVLEQAQRPVQVSDVDTILAGELGQALDELVTVRRSCREQRQEGGLAEALDARAYLPSPLFRARAASRAMSSATVQAP